MFSSAAAVAVMALCLDRVTATTSCDRSTLETIANSYMAAQTFGSLKPLHDLLLSGPGISYTENRKTANITTGILSHALNLAFNRSLYDTVQCATFTELIVTDPSHPYVIGSQIRLVNVAETFSDAAFDSVEATPSIASIDTIITSTGDWLFNASSTLSYASRENWGPIASTSPLYSSRSVIQAAADAYLDYFYNKSVVVPWGRPCDRLEGGTYTGNGSATDSCDVGVPSGVQLTERRYVVDEEMASVDVMLSFEGLPDSHEFRVEGGKLRFVHTMTVM